MACSSSSEPVVEEHAQSALVAATSSRPAHGMPRGDVAGAGRRAQARAVSARLRGKVASKGPLQVVALIGSSEPVGWAKAAPEGSALRGLLNSRSEDLGLPTFCGEAQTDGHHLGRHCLMGVALMHQWEFQGLGPQAQERDVAEQLLASALTSGRRQTASPVGLMSFPIVAAAALADPVPLPWPMNIPLHTKAFGDSVTSVFADRSLYRRAPGEMLGLDAMCAGETLGSVIGRWRDEHDLPPACALPIGYVMWALVAAVACRMGWPCDMVRVIRNERVPRRLLPSAPGRATELAFLDLLRDQACAGIVGCVTKSSPEGEIFGMRSKWGSGVCQFNPLHVVNVVGASAELKQLGRLSVSLKKHLKLAFPLHAEKLGELLLKRGFRVPSRFVLQRARIRLDVVAMLLRRTGRSRGVVSRSLSYDSSPQGGQELFASVDACILRGRSGEPVGGSRKSQVLTQLGHGHTGVVAKAMGLVHKVALEVGLDATAISVFL